MSKAKQVALEQSWREHNRFLKTVRCPAVTFSEFVDYVNGKRTKRPGWEVKTFQPTAYRRETPYIPSVQAELEDLREACAKKDTMRYTGSLVKGIATMHKSNAVPIIDQEQAAEISRMRR